MATTLSRLPLPPQSWEQDARPRSQPQASRERRSSPSQVKRQQAAADPVIINSILDSFDALHSPAIITTADGGTVGSDLARTRSRPHTAHESISSAINLATSSSPGFGMEYGGGLSMDEDSSLTGAAPPPFVRTSSRDGSGMSSYKSARSTSFMSVQAGHDRKRSASFGSHTSFSAMRKVEKDRPGKYKLSSESWVKQGPASPASLPKEWPEEREAQSPTLPRRKSSEEEIRMPQSRIEIMPTPSTASNLSRAEQIIALASAPRDTGSKRRLYLNDTGSAEEQSVLESPASIAEVPEYEEIAAEQPLRQVDENVDSVIQQILEDHVKLEEERLTATQRVSREPSIVDSIPMRTSSLRQSSSSPAPNKRKSRKSKRRSETGRLAKIRVGHDRDSFVSSTSSREIPDSSWNDLGEDDETVRRILELREMRRARMLEPPKSPIRGFSPSSRSEASSIATSDGRSARSESVKGSPNLRPETSRRATEPSPLSQRLRRTEEELLMPPSEPRPVTARKTRAPSPEVRLRHKRSFDDIKPSLRPLSANSNFSSNPPHSPINLEYSYANAMNVLQNDRPVSNRGIGSSPASPPPPRTPAQNTDPPSTKSPTSRSASVAMRSKTFRWRLSTQHPDLPLNYDKKGHLRAASLGNGTTQVEQPRDSVDLAVTEFLQAPRLSRKIKHPLTGRTISFSEVGDPEGAAVIICLGMGLTRYVSAFYDELAATLRLRLITIDRPGVGGSEPYPQNDKSGPLSWPDDVLAVCQHLHITKFSMLAHSAGAIYALATALILPHLIRGKLHLLSPWIPPSQLGMISNPATSVSPGGVLPRSQRILRVLPTPFFKAANASFMTATSASLRPNGKGKAKTELRRQGPSTPPDSRPHSQIGAGADHHRRESLMLMDQFMPDINPTDNFPVKGGKSSSAAKASKRSSAYRTATSSTANPRDPSFEFAASGLSAAEHRAKEERKAEYTSLLTQRTWDAATRDSNPATDLLICLERHRDIGFRYTDVHQEVIITHGSEDKRVPVANVRWLADQMNRHSLAFGSARGRGNGGGVDGLVGGGCEIRVLEGEAHGLMANPMIMGDLLTEIAGYWTGRG